MCLILIHPSQIPNVLFFCFSVYKYANSATHFKNIVSNKSLSFGSTHFASNMYIKKNRRKTKLPPYSPTLYTVAVMVRQARPGHGSRRFCHIYDDDVFTALRWNPFIAEKCWQRLLAVNMCLSTQPSHPYKMFDFFFYDCLDEHMCEHIMWLKHYRTNVKCVFE